MNGPVNVRIRKKDGLERTIGKIVPYDRKYIFHCWASWNKRIDTNALGMREQVLDELEILGIKVLAFYDKDRDETLMIPIAKFRAYATEGIGGEWGKSLNCPVDHFKTISGKLKTKFVPEQVYRVILVG